MVLHRVAPLLLVLSCAHPNGDARARPAPSATGPAALATGGATAADWARGAVFYEVFVRSYQDSDGDGVGDLRGLVARLDHLNDGDPATTSDLGVDAIWLMPIFASPSYHGYDTIDYETIQPAYGTPADFDRLIAEAHRRGIRVVLDLVLNHTSDEHPWFRESSASRTSPRRDWYVWRDENPRWGQPWNAQAETWHAARGAHYYGLFWGGMPDLNLRNGAVRAEVKRLASFWLARGVGGFRLDAVRHLVETGPGTGQSDTAETHAFLKEFAAHVRAAKPEAVLVGEAWTESPLIAAYHGTGGDELDVTFDFPLASRIVEGVRRGDATGIAGELREVARLYPPGAIDAPFLTNHDMRRVSSELGLDPAKLRSAAAVLLTLPGAPFIYYGEEIGLSNGEGGGDEAKRTPMRWDGTPGAGFTTGRPWHPLSGEAGTEVATQAQDAGSLLSHYRRLIRVRQRSQALRSGTLTLLPSIASVLAYLREAEGERVLVVHNLGAGPATYSHDRATPVGAPLFRTAGVESSPGEVRLLVPAGGTCLLRVQ